MLSAQILALTIALSSQLASAAIFPSDTTVKMLDAKGFKKAMKANQTSMVAFVAPWCGHCQRMAPEYSKASLGLYPLIPTYAVDCDDDKNKRLCADQASIHYSIPAWVAITPMVYDIAERTASGFFYWASRRIPATVHKIYHHPDIQPWVEKDVEQHRILLLTKDKRVPLLWKVLGNKYMGQLNLASHRDRKGKTSVKMGLEAGGKKEAKILVYPSGSTTPIRYEGLNKLDSLSKFFDSILDGTADLTVEIEIEQKQEAQRIALAHGGFVDLVDFEEAIKNGAGADFHDTNGYPGMMGAPPLKKKATSTEPEPQVETGAAGGEQVVFATKDSEMPATPTPAAHCTKSHAPGAEPECGCTRPKDEL
ncbi:hypothetical protein BD779DRAFT_1525488 [Infundibulicybe gibba]|nr:hypothetical protein BD779DRAFT_1525488 [Infundibulicybe gibba]